MIGDVFADEKILSVAHAYRSGTTKVVSMQSSTSMKRSTIRRSASTASGKYDAPSRQPGSLALLRHGLDAGNPRDAGRAHVVGR